MEGFMKEALRNIHTEEAGRITSTLLTDVSVRTQRKMLATRLNFLRMEREEAALENGQPEDDDDDSASEDAGESGEHAHSHAHSAVNTRGANSAERERREALGELATAFETTADPAACSPEELAATLRAMMVADIVELRQVLEREAQELRDLRKLKAESTRAGARRGKKKSAGSGSGGGDVVSGAGAAEGGSLIDQEVAAAEERARLTLSEEIVDMLEAKYGTAQHSGETTATLSSKQRCRTVCLVLDLAGSLHPTCGRRSCLIIRSCRCLYSAGAVRSHRGRHRLCGAARAEHRHPPDGQRAAAGAATAAGNRVRGKRPVTAGFLAV
jgi:hypothetical protein